MLDEPEERKGSCLVIEQSTFLLIFLVSKNKPHNVLVRKGIVKK